MVGAGGEPVLGWRLWRLHGGVLRSWALTHDWTPGPNRSRCRSPNGLGCTTSPGPGCHCGFWGLNSPLDCLARGRHSGIGWWPVMGLMRGWGTIAVHGDEGFRAEQAAVVCLFSDWPFLPWSVRGAGSPGSLLRRALTLLGGDDGPPPAHREERTEALRAAAAHYGVPLLSISDSLRVGLLQELGASPRALDELERWYAAGV